MQGNDLASRCTSVMMDVFNAVVAALPPTPAKFHYIFNLRDLGRITEGMMQVVPDKVNSVAAAVRLERHEILRILNDRMVGDEDKAFLSEKVEEAVQKHFSAEAGGVMADPILFGDFLPYHTVQDEGPGGDTVDLVGHHLHHAP